MDDVGFERLILNICYLVVTYNPNFEKLSILIGNLIESGGRVVIVNNGKSFSLEKINLSDNDSIEIFSLIKNEGIAKAQNIGIERAKILGCEYVVFFDQDSSLDNSFIKNLISDYNYMKNKNYKIAAVGPRFLDENKGFYFPALKFNSFGLIDKISVENIQEPIEVSFLISSGTLVSVAALEEIGNMKEEFFIDYVDTEWCFRALSKGYKLYMSEKAVMRHSVGDDTINLLNFKIPVHSGYRRYYRVRNLFFMWKMPYIPKILTSKLMITNFAIQILLFLLKDKKIDYIKYYFKAIKDGINQSRDYHV